MPRAGFLNSLKCAVGKSLCSQPSVIAILKIRDYFLRTPTAKMEPDDAKLSPTSEPSSLTDSTCATSVPLDAFSSDEDDIFDLREDSHYSTAGTNVPAARGEMLSDLPAMQRQHMTAGYREGLSDSKAKSMQGGFDQGYPIGFELGLKVGKIFGVLEGFLAAYAKDPTRTPKGLVELYDQAKKELAVGQLLDGLDDEVLASPDFETKDLPTKSTDLVRKWQVLMTDLMREQV